MSIRSFTRLFGVATLAAGLLVALSAPGASAKTTSTKKAAKTTQKPGKYLVPPPPPYQPSILPGLAYSRRHKKKKAEEPKSPYSKYIYTRAGYEIKSKKPNQYVTYWTK